MITQVSIVTLHVSDQEQARTFWRDTMGFEVRDDQEFMPEARWLTVAPPGGQASFALWPVAASGGLMEGKVGGFTGISLSCDDMQATYEALSARGVNFTQAPKQEGWGISAMFADPDGNQFHLVQPS